ncbi:MAG: hypothetical protein ACI4MH_03970 [Candidatus Coproplasma sp.]
MIMADWIAIGIVVVFLLLGLVAGFSGGLKFFTGGVFGVIISVVVCYFLYGIVLDWPFVNDLMTNLINSIQSAGNGFCDFLVTIHIETIALCIVMFVVVQIVRVIIVKILAGIAEIDNIVFKVINKSLGVVLFLAVAAMIGLIVFQVINWVGGETAANVGTALEGSLFKLDWLYANNPLNTMIEFFSV